MYYIHRGTVDHVNKLTMFHVYVRNIVVRDPGQRSRGPRFDSQRSQIFLEVVGLERGPFSLVRIREELLERTSSCCGIENRD
jgi:hypothetical protein